MTVVDISTRAGLNEILANNDKVVVDFAAPARCVPCQRLEPHYEAVAESTTDIKFVHVDVDTAEKALVDFYQIAGVPTVYAFKAGVQSDSVKGRTAPALKRELETIFQ